MTSKNSLRLRDEIACKVVNLKHEQYDVYIGRGSLFGNKFIIGKDGNRAEVIEKYRVWFEEKLNDDKFFYSVLALKGKLLGCYCKPNACHGDVIVEYLEGR